MKTIKQMTPEELQGAYKVLVDFLEKEKANNDKDTKLYREVLKLFRLIEKQINTKEE